jgi:hypothetical protein
MTKERATSFRSLGSGALWLTAADFQRNDMIRDRIVFVTLHTLQVRYSLETPDV